MNIKKGFTLIEILVVVAIIGILASIILVGLNSSRARARDTRRIADLKQIQNALELYFTANNQYPDVATWDNLKTQLLTVVNQISNDPLAPDRSYGYCYNSASGRYVLGAVLEQDNPVLNVAINAVCPPKTTPETDTNCFTNKKYCVTI